MRLTRAVLDVVQPDAFINGAIGAVEDTVAIGFIVAELTLVVITISVPECALTVRLIVLPLTLIFGPVLPNLDTEAVSDAASPIVHLVAEDGIHARARMAHDRRRLHHLVQIVAAADAAPLVELAG